MSALGNVVAGAGGALWWAAAAARDQALTDLAAEKGVAAQLRAGVDVQNRAITQWYEQAKAAEMRGAAAAGVRAPPPPAPRPCRM